MCKHAMNPAHYGHMSIDEEMYCTDNIMVAHYNMNQMVKYLTSTIGNVHNISIKPVQNISRDTVPNPFLGVGNEYSDGTLSR